MRALGLLLLALSFAIAPAVHAADNCVHGLLAEHNRHRVNRGLEALEIDEGLCEYAQRNADKMASRGALFHSSMSDLAAASGSGSVAENIAFGQTSEVEVVSSWMGSHGHRRNILGKGFTRVGFGMKKDPHGRKYWCSVFSD